MRREVSEVEMITIALLVANGAFFIFKVVAPFIKRLVRTYKICCMVDRHIKEELMRREKLNQDKQLQTPGHKE